MKVKWNKYTFVNFNCHLDWFGRSSSFLTTMSLTTKFYCLAGKLSTYFIIPENLRTICVYIFLHWRETHLQLCLKEEEEWQFTFSIEITRKKEGEKEETNKTKTRKSEVNNYNTQAGSRQPANTTIWKTTLTAGDCCRRDVAKKHSVFLNEKSARLALCVWNEMNFHSIDIVFSVFLVHGLSIALILFFAQSCN